MMIFKKTYFSLPFIFLGIIFFSCTQQEKVRESIQKPNVILILADDMGIGDIAIFNNDISKTPSINKLIDEGVYFNQAYAGGPVCAPSRAALLTGRHPHRTGAVTLNERLYPELTRIAKEEVTIADIFKKNGYKTALIGKWHSGTGEGYHPLNRGFDVFEGFNHSTDISTYYDYKLDLQGTYQPDSSQYLTDNFTQRAINFIRTNKTEPFFLFLAHYAPHRPLSAPEQLIQNYLDNGLNENTSTIYAMIEVMDQGVGELADELKKLGINNNTIILFSSDNGPDPIPGKRFNADQKGTKYTVNEGGIHVPFVVHWPGTLQPGERDQVIQFTDVLPTLADLLSLDVGEDLKWDGGSFKDILFNKNAAGDLPSYRYWQWNRGVPMYSHNAAMRDGDWKMVRPSVTRNVPDAESTAQPVLYNLAEDPGESVDVSGEHRTQYQKMQVYLRQWSRDVEHDRLKIDD